jgi:agmatine deiminase
MTRPLTPRGAGFAMPAEWTEHVACLMQWPTRVDLWHDELSHAKDDYATVARAIASFEPVLMLCNLEDAAEVRDRCGAGVEPLGIAIDDSWARDSGPTFVKSTAGEVAVVNFEFNAWGNRWEPYVHDNDVPVAIASHFGMRRFDAPMVLEGGSFFVDGLGTLVTTEQCLLNPNRNPAMSRADIEATLRDYLGVTTIIWLPYGHSADVGPEGTDGHVDGVLQYVAPGHVLLEVPSDPSDPDHARGAANQAALRAACDAAGSHFEVTILDPGPDASLSYSNFYLANGAVIVPVRGDSRDAGPLATIAQTFPEREVVGVPGSTLAFGGGGPHCITQQVPIGPPAAPNS